MYRWKDALRVIIILFYCSFFVSAILVGLTGDDNLGKTMAVLGELLLIRLLLTSAIQTPRKQISTLQFLIYSIYGFYNYLANGVLLTSYYDTTLPTECIS